MTQREKKTNIGCGQGPAIDAFFGLINYSIKYPINDQIISIFQGPFNTVNFKFIIVWHSENQSNNALLVPDYGDMCSQLEGTSYIVYTLVITVAREILVAS